MYVYTHSHSEKWTDTMACVSPFFLIKSNLIAIISPSFIYYEELIKQEIKGIHICGCRCNERLKDKTDVPRIHWVTLGTGTPKDRDEVNRSEFLSV